MLFRSSLCNGDVVESAGNLLRLQTGRGALAMYTPETFQVAYGFDAPSLVDGPVIGGYRIEVENREVALNHLDLAGVEWREIDSGHAIGPDVAAGAVMAFSEVF